MGEAQDLTDPDAVAAAQFVERGQLVHGRAVARRDARQGVAPPHPMGAVWRLHGVALVGGHALDARREWAVGLGDGHAQREAARDELLVAPHQR